MRRQHIIIGSRSSKLAVVQANSVLHKLQRSNPALEFTLSEIVTEGDRDHMASLDEMGGVGVFVKELEEALVEESIDIAVHSLKDMPTSLPLGLSLAAVETRLDPRDALVSRKGGLAALPSGSVIGTGSLRRVVQLKDLRPDLEARGIRGNIDTRLRKVSSGDFDGVILAAAALIRLGWSERITEYLSPERFLPAVGQGALGIEIRSGDAQVAEIVSELNHQPTWCSVTAERAFLQSLGGGCRAPIAALGALAGNMLILKGMVASPSRQKILTASQTGSAAAPEQVGAQLARRILKMGATDFISEARG